jgi:hypothetical protein
MTPRLIALRTSTSAYIAPSVSRSRMVVKPCSRAVRAAIVARIVRYGDRLLQELVFVFRVRDVALEQDVRVVVDEAGQAGRAAEVDHGRARGSGQAASDLRMRSPSTRIVTSSAERGGRR